jgi:branched-chain amino acid transport system ATP-binding protein
MTPLLQAQDVSISFGGLKAVQQFSLTLPKHALYGLIGPNGAGKTTVFNLLTGVYRPTSGSINVDGARVDGRKPTRSQEPASPAPSKTSASSAN